MASREIQSSSNVAPAGPSSQDILEIPPFIEAPKVEHLPNVKTLTHVVFDIETTNKYLFDNEIIQVSAACGEDHFDLKIDSPTKDQNVEQQQQVNAATSVKEALQKFLSWLQRFDNPVVLLSHNGKIFDIPRLIRGLQDYGLLDDFKAKVVGSVDTMILFKNYFSMEKNPSLRSLTEKHIPDYKYEAHDSLQDTLALKKLLETKANISEDQAFTDASFTLRYAIRYFDYARNRNANWQTLRCLPISKDMQKKIAGSGLQYCHLKEAYEMKGRDGIERVLSQEIHGKPRITKQQRIIMKICDHFQHRRYRLSRQSLIS